MAEGEVLALSQEMSLSRDDFLRLVPIAVGGAPFALEGDEIRSPAGRQGWRLVLHPLSPRVAGALSLPRLRVQLYLRGYSSGESAEFLRRLELAYRRGGG